MKISTSNYWGRSKHWWVLLSVGILMMVCGLAYWLWPMIGYEVASGLFGWVLILLGVVQLIVASGQSRPKGWGWWLAGGVLDVFIGFVLVRNIVLSEMLLPYMFALIFIYWGVIAIMDGAYLVGKRYWWLHLICGILMLLIGYYFIEGGLLQDMLMVSFLVSIAFIYWGIAICVISYNFRGDK